MRKICVVGTGYVGLVTGTCFAQLGNQVICLDVIKEKIDRLKASQLPFYEPELEQLIEVNIHAGRLHFTTDYAEALHEAEFIFIAVNTPTGQDGRSADMSYVESAARSIAEHLDHQAIIINKSTMPVGSGDLVSIIVREHLANPDLAIAVVSNPEFLREGAAVRDFLHPDRVVLGSSDRVAAKLVAELYLTLRAPIVITDLYTAEMIKYASNAFLATKISFINEIARICEVLGADVKEVAAGMGYDRRIGSAFLEAGLGYGGSCFPKDVRALTHMAAEAGLHPQLLEAVMRINSDQRHLVIDKLQEELGDLTGKCVAVFGLAFKDNTDDMRNAPSLDVIHWLLEAGAQVRAHDPKAIEPAKAILGDAPVMYCEAMYETAQDADAVVILTEWQEYRNLNPLRLQKVMRQPVLVDGRNLFDPDEMKRYGFRYRGIGRPNGHPIYTKRYIERTKAMLSSSGPKVQGQRIIVAGGAGFVGSHLCARLVHEGHDVLCLDNLVTGAERNIESLIGHPHFRYEQFDITTPYAGDFIPDAIYHLASPASPIGYWKHPFETIQANTQGTTLLLELARKFGARFLFTSTSEVYGDPLVHPQDESYYGNVDPIGPRACYDESKRLGETITMEYRRRYNVDTRIVRLFNTYGPNSQLDDGRMVPNFIVQALAGEPLTIYGDGDQTRSICFVEDIVDGLIRVMMRPDTNGEVFNLGNQEEQTIVNWAQMIIALCGSASTVVFEAKRENEPMRRRPNLAKALKMLEWSPKVAPEEGLRRTIEWFRAELTQHTAATARVADMAFSTTIKRD